MGVTDAILKEARLGWMGQLVLETNQHISTHRHNLHGNASPIREDLHDAMMSGDIIQMFKVVRQEEAKGVGKRE
jgi:hypothetical protein